MKEFILFLHKTSEIKKHSHEKASLETLKDAIILFCTCFQGDYMPIELKYTTIPTVDKVVASHFYERVFGFKASKHKNLKINDELTFKFKNCETFNILHFAFNVDQSTFEDIMHNIKKERISFSNDPFALSSYKKSDHEENTNIYFRDPNGHIIELIKE